jgi:hypothetical protein
MKVLVRLRPVILLIFAGAGIAAFIALWLNKNTTFVWLVDVAYIAIFLFLLTESFGELAAKRTKLNRSVARVFLLLSGVVILGTSLGLLRGA